MLLTCVVGGFVVCGNFKGARGGGGGRGGEGAPNGLLQDARDEANSNQL